MEDQKREYKFRVWDDFHKKMYYSHPDEYKIHSPEEAFRGLDHFWYTITRHHKGVSEVMQYTGLKDKNGKEIYEGDIVEMIWGIQEVKSKFVKVVEWNKNYTGFDPLIRTDLNNATFKVIGNIYENKDLI